MEIINVADQIIEVNVTNDIVNIQAQTGAYPLPNNVYSVFGRVGNVIATEGDYTLTQLGDVTLTSPASGQVLKYNGSAWVNGADNNSVTSVFGRTGVVTAQSGDYTSLQVTEDTNLYFTNQRARYAISGDSNSGVVYQNTTGIIALDDIPNTSLLHDKVTINTKDVALGGSLTLSTTDIGEGTNLYFTNARAQNALTYGNLTSGDMDVSGGTNAVIGSGASLTLKNVNANVGTYGSSTAIPVVSVNAKGLVTGISTQSVFIPSGALNFIGDVTGTGNTGTDTTLTLASVNSNVGSYGTSTSVPTIVVNAKGLVTAASQTAIPTAASGTTGLLTSTDYNLFKAKQDALNGTGFVKSTAGVISYDTNTYLTTISGISAGGELSGTYANPSLVNNAVTGKVLTGLNLTGGGTIADTDSILGAFGKVQNQISALVGGVMYEGTWNASTNSPSITSSVGTKGHYYIVATAGNTNINGITDWKVGDWIIFNGSTWDKVDNTDAVSSVNGYTGAVSLTTSDISEGTNLYYTDTRARASNSAGTGISYNTTTGVITNAAPDQVVALSASGTTTITGTYPNFTISSADQYVGSVTSVGLTMPSAFSVSGSPISTSGVFSVTATGDTTQYIAGDGSLVSFPIAGQAGTLVRQVRNQTGATLTKGTIVYISGASGNKALVSKALATSDSTSAQTFGMVQADISNNNNGYVVCVGDLAGLNTLAYTEGTQLYLSSTNAGEYTSTKQYAPAHLVYIGVVTRSHANQGQIEVKIQNGYEMDELHDVSAQSPSNGDILQYVSSTGLWTKTAGTTTNIAEGTNLYYTQSRFDTAFGNKTTSNLAEGTNLYYTDARSRGAISLTTTGNNGASTYNSTTGVLNVPTYTLAGLGGINLTSLSATSPLLYNNTTGVFSIQQSSGSQAGYLSSADWTTFNNKVSSQWTTTGSNIYYSTGNVGIGTSTINNGAFSSTTLSVQGVGANYGAIELGRTTAGISQNLGVISFYNSSTYADVANIIGVSEGANNSGALRFGTMNAGTYSEKLRVSASGQLYNSNAPANDWAAIFTANTTTSQSFGLKVVGGTNGNDKPFLVRTPSTELFSVLGNGNVGINNATPGYTLDLGGSMQISISTYQKIQTYFSSPYISGFKFSDLYGSILYNAGSDTLSLNSFGTIAFTRGATGATESMKIRSNGNKTFNGPGGQDQLFSNYARTGNGDYIDIDTESGGGNFQGFIIVQNNYAYNAGYRTQGVYAILGRGTTISVTTISQVNGPTGSSGFSITAPSAGVIRITNAGLYGDTSASWRGFV